jgi:hypothetical protein
MKPEGVLVHETDMCWEKPLPEIKVISYVVCESSTHNPCLDNITNDISSFRGHVFTRNKITCPLQRKWFDVTGE